MQGINETEIQLRSLFWIGIKRMARDNDLSDIISSYEDKYRYFNFKQRVEYLSMLKSGNKIMSKFRQRIGKETFYHDDGKNLHVDVEKFYNDFTEYEITAMKTDIFKKMYKEYTKELINVLKESVKRKFLQSEYKESSD